MFTLTGVNVAILNIGQGQVLMGVEMELFLNKEVELVMRNNRQTNVSHLPCGELSLMITQFLKCRDPVLVEVSHEAFALLPRFLK